MKPYFVYILSNKKDGVLYVGFTDDVRKRLIEHKNKRYDGFTKKYNVDKLVYFEKHGSKNEAEKREMNLKKWNRAWKIQLIEKDNPEWNDLFETLVEKPSDFQVLEMLYGKKNYESKLQN